MKELLIKAAVELAPYVIALLVAAIGTATAWLQRKRIQLNAAVDAATAVEVESAKVFMPSEHKKSEAMSLVAEKLPLYARPLTHKGLGNLVEKAVPAARERAKSLIPPPPAGHFATVDDDDQTPPAA